MELETVVVIDMYRGGPGSPNLVAKEAVNAHESAHVDQDDRHNSDSEREWPSIW